MAAGKGTRMKSKLPKLLQPICGKPMVSYVADAIRNTGISEIVGVIPAEEDGFTHALGDSITLIEQNNGPGGTGAALYSAKHMLKESDGNVLVINGDLPLITANTILRLIELHSSIGSDISVLTVKSMPSLDMGKIVRDNKNNITHINEYDGKNGASDGEGNVGVYCFKISSLKETLTKLKPSEIGDYRITDIIPIANENSNIISSLQIEDYDQALGVNNGVDLSIVRQRMQRRINEKWLLNGVSIIEPAYIDESAYISSDSIIYPNTFISGNSYIGSNAVIGPNSIVNESSIGAYSRITQSVVENSILENNTDVGPYSHIRPDSHIESNVHIGNYAEIKNSRIGEGTQIGHFSYLGDSDVGTEVNIGAGVITCNFDGRSKHKTSIGDRAFIGSDSLLIAPLNIGHDTSTGAGSVITKDVPDGVTVIGMPARKLAKKQSIKTHKDRNESN